jgi:Arc/MetJ-type ribon-helix-helix transcriptional regulator
MRDVINISLPRELARIAEAEVKSGKFATKSEFFRMLLRLWDERILIEGIQKSEKEFATGKGKKLISLKDLR